MTRRRYPPEFRRQLIELVQAGRSPESLAKEFEPSGQTIRNWAVQAARDTGTRSDGLTSAERAELTRLRRELRQVKLEREILSKSHGLVRTGDRHDPQRLYGFVRDHQASYPVAPMCRVLRVSPSGFYAWHQRGPSARAERDGALLAPIRHYHARSNATYGRPRGRESAPWGRHHAPRSRGDPRGRSGPPRLHRDSTESALGGGHHPRADLGRLSLSVRCLDVFSRRIVGWAMATHLKTDLVLDALNMALSQRRPHGVIHHSDRGSQYTALAFGQRCQEMGVQPSRGAAAAPTTMRWRKASLPPWSAN